MKTITSEVLGKSFNSLKGYKIALTRYENSIIWEFNYVEEEIHRQTELKIFPRLYHGELASKVKLELSAELRKIKKERIKIEKENEDTNL